MFDVDGTLTESRQPAQRQILIALRELAKYTEIGFLTGSGLEYVKEQLWPILNDSAINSVCHILPCNGTEYYIPSGENPSEFLPIFQTSMKQEIGEENFKNLMKILCILQADIVMEGYDINYSGHFIQNRGSMLNWCPIGRNATQLQRKEFTAVDHIEGIRDDYLEALREKMHLSGIENIVAKFGGDTSFDIYPKGWDKTFVMNHFPVTDWEHWFVGDRCSPNGNDFEIFNLLKPLGTAYETSGPEDTVEIIDFHLLRDLERR